MQNIISETCVLFIKRPDAFTNDFVRVNFKPDGNTECNAKKGFSRGSQVHEINFIGNRCNVSTWVLMRPLKPSDCKFTFAATFGNKYKFFILNFVLGLWQVCKTTQLRLGSHSWRSKVFKKGQWNQWNRIEKKHTLMFQIQLCPRREGCRLCQTNKDIL